ncbi:FkbM family methyltransferase [uncultured Anaerovibrio sp.]|uniref:FkbM family methyltransferase n=1 Tax=uncultured Anaerovibrio sp. TaxID=361586 RepID=UPI002625AD50|nr:FkbM family methyltransferase [uncultured Anaerovibrio sp.]
MSKIYAFEPLPDTFAKMKHNLELNGLPEKIYPVNVGMSDKAGTFDFYLPGENEAASMQPNMDEFYMQESVDGHYTGVKKMDKVECKVTTLDEYVVENNIDRVNFIKIDVEGNEKNVLLGGAEVLKKYHPTVYCEMLRKHAARFGYHPNEIIEYMQSLGYSCYTLHDGELIPFAEMTEETVETNFFFVCGVS